MSTTLSRSSNGVSVGGPESVPLVSGSSVVLDDDVVDTVVVLGSVVDAVVDAVVASVPLVGESVAAISVSPVPHPIIHAVHTIPTRRMAPPRHSVAVLSGEAERFPFGRRTWYLDQ
jgi:hypothetical protein